MTCIPSARNHSDFERFRRREPTPKKLLELRRRGMQDLAGVAVDEVEAESGGPVAKPTQHARTLLEVVDISTGIPVDEFPFECAIDQDGELAGGRRDRRSFTDAPS